MHVISPSDEPQHGHRLVGGNDHLHPWPPRPHQPHPQMRITTTARPEDGVVAGVINRPDQAEPLGQAAAPLQGRLTAAAVVAEGLAAVVVAAAQHRGAVVVDGVDAHHPEPGHDTSASPTRRGCNRLLAVGVMADRLGVGRGLSRGRAIAAAGGARRGVVRVAGDVSVEVAGDGDVAGDGWGV